MINNLTEESILEYLMTSEFNDGLTPEEFKFLLYKFRNHYRVLNSKSENLKSQIEIREREKSDILKEKDRIVSELQTSNSEIRSEINKIINRKLSFKERISGKIIIEDNETK